MALFSIERYMGDDDEEEALQSPASNQAQDILQRLHKQAELRKQQTPDKEKLICDDSSGEPNSTPKRKKKKVEEVLSEEEDAPSAKKKKQKLSLDSSLEEKESEKATPSKKSKKDRRKSKDKSNLPDKHDMSVQEESSPEKSPKKKKHKREKEEVAEEDSKSESEQEEETDSGEESDREENDAKVEENLTKAEGQIHREVGGFTVIGDVRHKQIQKVERVLPDWLAQPSVINNDLRNNRVALDAIPGLDPMIINKLRENNIKDFFPVQSQIIPVLLDTVKTGLSGKAGFRPCDICCSAPTGSGKTLAFVVPIVQALNERVVSHVRALVVLPVRDLATQVYGVFQTYCQATDLKVALITGQKTLATEQQALVRKGVRGYQSRVDIIVATPGRLVDHINNTPGFSLQHLRFLVIDEADRMMEDIKHDWLTQVEKAVHGEHSNNLHDNQVLTRYRPIPGPIIAANAGKRQLPLQKLLFSATLSQNPEKLQQLNLFQPKLFTSVVSKPIPISTDSKEESAESKENISNGDTSISKSVQGDFVGKFTTPSGLKEFFIQTDPQQKPLTVLYLLHQLRFKHVLCFTNSLEATHRLYWLVKLVGGIEVREFSSNLHAQKRNRIVKQFSAGKINLLICSDAMARGMDVENVQYVISYEPPPYLKTYIHRVGRTARAGKSGTAVTLLEKKQIYHFKSMLKEAGKTNFEELKVTKADLRPLVEAYTKALTELEDVLKAEKKKKR